MHLLIHSNYVSEVWKGILHIFMILWVFNGDLHQILHVDLSQTKESTFEAYHDNENHLFHIGHLIFKQGGLMIMQQHGYDSMWITFFEKKKRI